MTVKKIAKILWSPVKRVDELLRVDSDVAELYPEARLGKKDAAVTEGIIGMQAQAAHRHIGQPMLTMILSVLQGDSAIPQGHRRTQFRRLYDLVHNGQEDIEGVYPRGVPSDR